jgi:hypothetical protein
MHPNPQPDNVFLSFLITAVIMASLVAVYILFRYRRQLKQKVAGIERILGQSTGLKVFTWARVLVGIAGVGALIVTVLPGLMPFQAYSNQNLGLGGIIYIVIIWPLILVQITAAFIPYSNRLIARQPIAAWIILLVVGQMAISLDIAAINGMYDFTLPQG